MVNLGSEGFQNTRKLAAKIYFQWLLKFDILQKIESPETIPSIFYNLGYPSEEQYIFEKIFNFLHSFNILQEAGGTYVLSRDITKLKQKYEEISRAEKLNPTYHYINYGMKLVEERLEGGTGIWDMKQYGYIFEIGFTQSSSQYHSDMLEEFIDKNRIIHFFKKPNIALYSNYPEKYIKGIDQFFGQKDDYVVITPNKMLKEKAITYCELSELNNKFSENIYSREELPNKKFDVFFVTNGLAHHFPMKSHFNFIKGHLSKNGFFIFRHNITIERQLGIEPLFTLHPSGYELPSSTEFNRLIKANGFDIPRYTSENSFFSYCMKAS